MNVDWDLLADHLGGALAGTPEGARVERLVATDPGWARAAGELSAALDAVAGDLRTLATPTLPDDVAARLDAALATATAPDVAAEVRPLTSPAPAGRSADEPRRPPSHPGTSRRRRRVTRWSAGLAVAAGVATFAAIGLGSWLGNWQPEAPVPGLADQGGDDGEGAAPAQEPMEEERPRDTEGADLTSLIVATGDDYQEETLATAEPPPPTLGLGGQDQPSPPPQAPTDQTDPDEVPPSVPQPLFRLWTDPAERAACLQQIVASLRPPPVSITTVDFATFEGQPALVIWATTGDGARWAWVSGPDCGEVVGDPDVRFQTQLP